MHRVLPRSLSIPKETTRRTHKYGGRFGEKRKRIEKIEKERRKNLGNCLPAAECTFRVAFREKEKEERKVAVY